MSPMLVLDAFGSLSSGTDLINADEEDLYSVLRARAELMGWSTSSEHRSLLWNMHEAELTFGDDGSRIGFLQVGLDVGDIEESKTSLASVRGYGYAPLGMRRSAIEPAIVLPALTQCFVDALCRFGTLELTGLQVTASYLEPSTRFHGYDLSSALNWFNTNRKTTVNAIITINHEVLGGDSGAKLFSSLQRRGRGSFKFRPETTLPGQHWIGAPIEESLARFISPERSGLGLSVSMSEWTASAVGWALAIVIDSVRASAPYVPHFSVRVTRLP